MTTISPEPITEHRVVMEGISWDTYQRMLADIGEGRTRLTYDEGRLEVMSPSPFHEKLKKLIGRLLEAYADAIEIELEGFGSMTCAREDLKKGLEPDECYYVQNAPAVMGRDDIDLTVDPPPDLAIEVEVSRSSVSRQPIYFALGVGEVWVFRAGKLIPMLRGAESYEPATASRCFPDLPLDQFYEFVVIAQQQSQSAASKALREWVRARRQK